MIAIIIYNVLIISYHNYVLSLSTDGSLTSGLNNLTLIHSLLYYTLIIYSLSSYYCLLIKLTKITWLYRCFEYCWFIIPAVLILFTAIIIELSKFIHSGLNKHLMK